MKSTKDLAQEMELHPRTVKRWWKRLGVPPDVAGNSCHRWSNDRAALLVKRWGEYWARLGKSAAVQAVKYAGLYTDKNQLELWKDYKATLPTGRPLPGVSNITPHLKGYLASRK